MKLRMLQALLFLSIAAGCASNAPKPDASNETAPTATEAPVPPAVQGPPESYGPREASGTFGPNPVMEQPMVIVFGPGMARSFATVGVLKALQDEKIRIGAIYGTEMGALFAALYAVNGNVNGMEWALQKMRDDVFLNQSRLLPDGLRRRSSSDRFEKALEGAFKGQVIERTKVPLRVAYADETKGTVFSPEKGDLATIVRAATARPDYYTSVSIKGQEMVATARAKAFLVQEARALGMGPVVVIDTRPTREATSDADLGLADLVLRPELKDMKETDFNRRSEAVFAGKSVVRSHLETLRRLRAESRN